MSRVLSEGAVFCIREDRDCVICALKPASAVSPEEGAACATRIRDTFVQQVITEESPYRAALFDARLGPSAFGPKTREQLSGIFEKAGIRHFPLSVLVSGSATQRFQFGNLVAEFAADCSRVFTDEVEARAFLG